MVDLFFVQSNLYLPLLHRPTFERSWCEQLHHQNVWFATLCILVFAVASRWYDSGGKELHDWLRGDDEWKVAGWRWFFIGLDVHCIRRSLTCPASLLEIQTSAVRLYLIISIGHEVCLTYTVAHGPILAGDNMCRRWLAICFDWTTESTG